MVGHTSLRRSIQVRDVIFGNSGDVFQVRSPKNAARDFTDTTARRVPKFLISRERRTWQFQDLMPGI